MTNVWVGSLPLAVFSILQAEMVSAWSCSSPDQIVLPANESLLSDDELLRHQSKAFFANLRTRLETDVVVIGQFTKNAAPLFLHEEQLDEIRGLFWPPAKNVQMPYQIEYTYLDAFRFEGHQVLNGEVVPYVAEGIDARISISAEYEGIVDALPSTENEVIGVLRPVFEGNRLELIASPCPTYHPVGPSQLADLLVCIKDGECK